MKYIVKLSEQEEMAIRQLANQPGFEVLFKFLQCESLDTQAAAMECTDPDDKRRLMLLTDAQSTARIVSHLTQRLAAYRQEFIPEAPPEVAQIIEDLWNKESN